MKTIRVRLYEYMKAENLAESTIIEYMKQYDIIKKERPDFDEWQSEQCINYLASIKDPIYRSHKRNIILKVHRDLLGKHLNIPFIKKPVRLQKIYSHDEVKRIFSCINNKKHEAIARLLYVEGMRVGEIINILLIDCSKEDKSICIRRTKNRKDYKKFIDDSTIKCLTEYCDWLRERKISLKKYLFEGCDNNQYSRRSVQQIMSHAIEKSNLDKRGSCHVFRRSNATWKIENGWSLKHIAQSLNNTEKTVSKYYAYVRPDYIKSLPKPNL